MSQDEVLGREVAISAKVEETGIAVRAKSRAVAALDRLIGSLADLPSAYVEGVADKRRLRDQIERRKMEVQAEISERKLRGLEQAGDAILLEVIKDAARKQANTAGVAIEAVEAMKALPPPSEAAANDGVNDDIDPDWLNQFSRFAEDASSDQLQQLWGRVLAGEVNRPGAFSRYTLRFVAELDKETALNCEFAAERLIGDFIPKTEEWESGKGLIVGLDLQRLGLLEGVGGLGFTKTFSFKNVPLLLVKGENAVLIYGKDGGAIVVESILVTRLGSEVFSLLEPVDNTSALRTLGAMASKAPATKIELGTHVADGDRRRFHTNEVLWVAPTPSDK